MNWLFILLFAGFAWSVGFLAFHGAPVLESLRKRSRTFSNLHLWLATWCVNRAVLVLRADGELDWKKLRYDDVGAEKVRFGSVLKYFADPDDSLSAWLGRPFAIADEIHGVLFTPAHAAIGEVKGAHDDRDELFARATDAEAKAFGIVGWIRSVFEVPGTPRLVDLSAVRELATGSERAEHPDQAEQFYIYSRSPDGSQMSLVRLLLPFLWFVGLLVLFWQIGSRTGGGGGGGDGSTISYTAIALASVAPAEVLRRRIGSIVVLAAAVLAVGAVAAFVGPLLAIVGVVCFALGFTFVPFLGLALGFLRIGGHLSRLFVRLGLLGYREPVFYYDADGYRLLEFEELPAGASVGAWHVLANTRVGFGFDPAVLEDGPDHVPVGSLQQWASERQNPRVKSDGSTLREVVGWSSAVPEGSYRAPFATSGTADYAGFLPAEPDGESVYVQSNIAGQRLDWGFEGDVTDDKHQAAKEEYGDGNLNSIGDRMVIASMVLSTIVATGFGWWVFL